MIGIYRYPYRHKLSYAPTPSPTPTLNLCKVGQHVLSFPDSTMHIVRIPICRYLSYINKPVGFLAIQITPARSSLKRHRGRAFPPLDFDFPNPLFTCLRATLIPLPTYSSHFHHDYKRKTPILHPQPRLVSIIHRHVLTTRTSTPPTTMKKRMTRSTDPSTKEITNESPKNKSNETARRPSSAREVPRANQRPPSRVRDP